MGAKNKPLLSVITPVYNGADYLEETLHSLVHSDYENLEFIVLDDGSTDDSAEIARRVLTHSGRTFQIVVKENTGEADTDNQGLALAKGVYIAIVNCDDPVYPQLFSSAVETLESDPAKVVAYPDWDMIDETGVVLKTVRVREYSLDSLLGDLECLPGPGAVIRRSAIKSPILRDPRFRYTSDYRQWLTLSTVGDFVRIPKSLCTWRIHSAQQTVQASGSVQAREMIGCIEDFFARDIIREDAASLKSQAFSMAYYLAAVQSLHRRGVPGRRLLAKSLVTTFRRKRHYQPARRSIILALLVLANPLGRLVSQYATKRRFAIQRKLASHANV